MTPPALLACLGGGPPQQVGLVVRDLDAALERYARLWGVGPFACYTYGPERLAALAYRGEPGRYAMRVALADGFPQIELIEPLAGPSIYHEWLERHGEGLHHLAFTVDSVADGQAELEAAGFAAIQTGSGYGLDGDGAYAYFDTEAALGFVLELREIPRRRRPPEAVWPAGADAPPTASA